MDQAQSQDIVAPSSGIHLVLPSYYSSKKFDLLNPQTTDGRVIFCLPWLGHILVGITDEPSTVQQHPIPGSDNVQWLLKGCMFLY